MEDSENVPTHFILSREQLRLLCHTAISRTPGSHYSRKELTQRVGMLMSAYQGVKVELNKANQETPPQDASQ